MNFQFNFEDNGGRTRLADQNSNESNNYSSDFNNNLIKFKRMLKEHEGADDINFEDPVWLENFNLEMLYLLRFNYEHGLLDSDDDESLSLADLFLDGNNTIYDIFHILFEKSKFMLDFTDPVWSSNFDPTSLHELQEYALDSHFIDMETLEKQRSILYCKEDTSSKKLPVDMTSNSLPISNSVDTPNDPMASYMQDFNSKLRASKSYDRFIQLDLEKLNNILASAGHVNFDDPVWTNEYDQEDLMTIKDFLFENKDAILVHNEQKQLINKENNYNSSDLSLSASELDYLSECLMDLPRGEIVRFISMLKIKRICDFEDPYWTNAFEPEILDAFDKLLTRYLGTGKANLNENKMKDKSPLPVGELPVEELEMGYKNTNNMSASAFNTFQNEVEGHISLFSDLPESFGGSLNEFLAPPKLKNNDPDNKESLSIVNEKLTIKSEKSKKKAKKKKKKKKKKKDKNAVQHLQNQGSDNTIPIETVGVNDLNRLVNENNVASIDDSDIGSNKLEAEPTEHFNEISNLEIENVAEESPHNDEHDNVENSIPSNYMTKCGFIDNELYFKSARENATEDEIVRAIQKIEIARKQMNLSEADDVYISYTSDEDDIVYIPLECHSDFGLVDFTPTTSMPGSIEADVSSSEVISEDLIQRNDELQNSEEIIEPAPIELTDDQEPSVTLQMSNKAKRKKKKDNSTTLSEILSSDTSKKAKKQSKNQMKEQNSEKGIMNVVATEKPIITEADVKALKAATAVLHLSSKYTNGREPMLRKIMNAPKTQMKTSERQIENTFVKAFDHEEQMIEYDSSSSSDEETEDEDKIETETETETGNETWSPELFREDMELVDNLDQLSSIFGDIPLKHLQIILERTNGNMDEATETCLSYDYLKTEFETQKPSFKWEILEKKQAVYVENRVKAQKASTIVESVEDIKITIERMDKKDIVLELLNLNGDDGELVCYYLKRNQDVIHKAVLDILINWKHGRGIEEQGTRKLHETRMPDTTKTGKSYADALRDVLTKNIKYEKLDLISEHVSQEAWKELAYLIKNDSNFKMPSTFYLNAMVWFEYEVTNVLILAYRLKTEFGMDYSGETFKGVRLSKSQICQFVDHERKQNVSKEIFGDDDFEFKLPDRSSKVAHIRGVQKDLMGSIKAKKLQIASEKNKNVRAIYSSQLSNMSSQLHEAREEDQNELFETMKTNAITYDEIDLHGFTVNNAVELVSITLKEWWEEETVQRNLNGTRSKSGKVIHVNEFNIVTGRGLHSANNMPKIRPAVKRVLQLGKWMFTENPSNFVIVGKK